MNKFWHFLVAILALVYFTTSTNFAYAENHPTGLFSGSRPKKIQPNFNGEESELTPSSERVKVEELRPDQLTEEDLDWPIVFYEKHEFHDTETGLLHVYETTIREQKRALDSNETNTCNTSSYRTSGGVLASLSVTCSYQFIITRTDAETIYSGSNWITAEVKSKAEKWCTPNCISILVDMTELRVTWYRNNANWTVNNAITRWGCAGCVKCDGGDYNYVYVSPTFTPNWHSSTQSYTYLYTFSSFPVMRWATVNGPWPTGSNESKVYYNGQYKGKPWPVVTWND